MDKALFKAYVREIVREEIEHSIEKNIKKILPEILGEAIQEIKKTGLQENTSPPPINRERMAQLLGIEKHGDTITANLNPSIYTPVYAQPENGNQSNPAVAAINRNYSEHMKKMGLVK